MSPAINDPFSAMTCLDYLGNCLAIFVGQTDDDPNVYAQDGQLRLVYESVTFEELLNAAFDMLRHASCDNASVLLQMLKVMEAIGRKTKTPEERQYLLRHVNLVQEESSVGNLTGQDRQLIVQRSESLRAKLLAAA